jgi:hypothetical protein
LILTLAPTLAPSEAQADDPAAGAKVQPEHGGLGKVGAKLADPTADIWALQFNISAPSFYDGNINEGNDEIGGSVVFQPVMPIPLYGKGENKWKMITRPVVPIILNQPKPTGPDRFKQRGGLGDIQLPFLLNPSEKILGNWIFAAGPVFEFPTGTTKFLSSQQFSVGPAVALGYKTPKMTAVLFPNYFFGYADRGDRDNNTDSVSKLSMLYALIFNLPDAWQIGTNPSISYNAQAGRGDKWTVPIGIFGARTIKIGNTPMNIRAGIEYSVVRPDSFGQVAQIKFQITPVIPGLISKSIFGGN